jgi:hypothetical protein
VTATSPETLACFAPRLSGIIMPPGRSNVPTSALRRAIARPPWTPVVC